MNRFNYFIIFFKFLIFNFCYLLLSLCQVKIIQNPLILNDPTYITVDEIIIF